MAPLFARATVSRSIRGEGASRRFSSFRKALPAVLACWCFAVILWAQPNPGEGYLGAQACAACHRRNFETQSQSEHAHALFPAASHPLIAKVFTGREWSRPPDFQFQFDAKPDGIRVRLAQRDRHVEFPVEWAFGAGDQAITFVSQLEQERYVEYAFTWYSKSGALDLTAGHPQKQPVSLLQALGIAYDVFSVPATIMACFQCHSTGPVELKDDYGIRPAELGVRCEVCHGPGREHVAAVEQGNLKKARAAIGNPMRLTAAKINDLCGDCHRLPPNAGRTFDFTDPWHVRHQPPFLAQSRCFRESKGALTCFTCHGPHEKLRRDAPEHYNSRCAGCHGDMADNHPAVPGGSTSALDDCIGCHMPKVQPQPHLSFTNHWIGIYDGNALKPRR